MTLTDLLVPTYRQMLARLSDWIGKAADDRLAGARLAADMFPLATQVRFACVQVYESVSRLTSQDVPPVVEELLKEGRAAGEQPGTLAEARARIDAALALLEGLSPDALDSAAGQPLAHALPNGMVFDFTAEQYARDWALPQFYFHVMAAYTILRHMGVPLGKVDYVAYLFPYLRPETAPGS